MNLATSRDGSSGDPTMGASFSLESITAVALGGVQACSLGQFAGCTQCLSVVAQHRGGQQQGGYVQITLGGC